MTYCMRYFELMNKAVEETFMSGYPVPVDLNIFSLKPKSIKFEQME